MSHSTLADVFRPGRRRLDLDVVVAVLRALGLDEAEVSHWRDNCLRVHAEQKTGGPVGVFRQLPPDLATFTGREDELRALITAAARTTSGTPTVVISAIEGMAGIGKTRLAVHAAHQLVRAGHYPDGQFFVNLRGFDPEQSPADPTDVLDALLRQLEVPASHIPAGRDERAAMFRDRLHDKHALLILDNAAGEDQIRDLIPASPTCLVLITSRRSMAQLDAAHLHQLDVFPLHEAIALLAQVAGAARVAAEPEAAAEIVHRCGYLPLAVSVAASRLRSRPTWMLSHLAQRLRDNTMAALTVGGKELPQIFELSYRALPEAAQRVFRLAGLHVGEDFSAPGMAALADLEPTAVLPLLDLLQDENLIQENTQGRYELHDLLRVFARHCLDAEEPAPDQALDRLLDWYLNTADGAARIMTPSRIPTVTTQVAPGRHRLPLHDYRQAQEWLDAEHSCLMSAIHLTADTDRHHHLSLLPRAMYELFRHRGHTRDWENACRLAITSAHRHHDQDTEAWMTNSLGLALTRQGRLTEAITEFQTSADLRHTLGQYPFELSALTNLGLTAIQTGHHEAAESTFHRVLARNQEAEDVWHGRALSGLGEIYIERNELTKALKAKQDSLAIFLKLRDQVNVGEEYLTLAQILYRQGEPEESTRYLRLALEVNEELGVLNVLGMAWELQAEIWNDEGNRPGAIEALTKAYELLAQSDEVLAQRVAGRLEELRGSAASNSH
ncbi:ATP-binding protein [Catenulispora yoronensis]